MSTIIVAAFAAGMVSTVNPCGFAMLPAYLGFFLGDRADRAAGRVGAVSVAVAAGFLAVFTLAGTLIGLGIRAVVSVIPWTALVVGAGLIVVGISQILGKRLLPYLRGPSRVRKQNSLLGMFGFGVSYALASLSCTLPIFLTLVTGAVASGSAGEAVLTFVAYGLGMSVVVIGLTVAVAVGRQGLIRRIRPLASRLDAISGWVMTVAGVFIVWYWATVLASGAGALGSSSLVRGIDRASAWVTNLVADHPIETALAVLGATLAVLAIRRGTRDTDPEKEPASLA